jgi:hypothetical protein
MLKNRRVVKSIGGTSYTSPKLNFWDHEFV